MKNAMRMTAALVALGFAVSMAKDPDPAVKMDKGADTAQCDKRGEGLDRHRAVMWREHREDFARRRMEAPPMAAQILPSSDGGVIVMRGGTLYKYDKDLNLKKQIELPRPEWMKEPMDGKGPMHRHWAESDSSGMPGPGK